MTKLASSCSYPRDYFTNLRAESNEELEVYRNDIRDLLRALTGGEDDELLNVPRPSLQLLYRTTLALREEIRHNQQIPPETFVHTFSTLAKPLSRLARDWLRDQDEPSKCCLYHALEVLSACLERVTVLFRESLIDIQLVLPLARTLNIGVASTAPMLSALATSSITQQVVSGVLPLATRLSLFSLRFLPELATSENLRYEIRGTMRGPGGEDHVGSLSLMRLTSESDLLTSFVVQAVAPEIKELCKVHEYLKSMERCWDESPNPKTTPKSRRILLGVICRLEISSRGQAGASEMLSTLVHSAVSSIASIDSISRLDEQSFFLLCETAHDLASLAPLLSSSFFDQGENKKCLEILRSAVVQWYMVANQHGAEIDGSVHQVRL